MSKHLLLINLGSPSSLKLRHIRKYLRQFLMDKYVIDIPFVFRFLLVNFIIVPFRSFKTRKAYAKVWGTDSINKYKSPLLQSTYQLAQKIQANHDINVSIAMRYGKPSISQIIKEMSHLDSDELEIIPLYPQYAISSYKTAVENIKSALNKSKQIKKINTRIHAPFYSDPSYLKVLSNKIHDQLPEKFDHLLFSYHGMPIKHITDLDTSNKCFENENCCSVPEERLNFCYRAQCQYTTLAVAKALNLEPSQYSISFQSRLTNKWIKPFTDKVAIDIAKKKTKHLVVVSPSFTNDCLETLEELKIELKKNFFENGGEKFSYISCLNDDDDFAKYLFNKATS